MNIEDKQIMSPKRFTGTLGLGDNKVEIGFAVCVKASGEAVIALDRIPLDSASKFILFSDGDGTRFTQFNLAGQAPDGASFECDTLIFTSLNTKLEDEELTISATADYSFASLVVDAKSLEVPVLKWHLKGFQSFEVLQTTCPLGTVSMCGAKDMNVDDQISGFIQIEAGCVPSDAEKWHKSAEDLCNHLHHVMSFAVDVYLACPISEFVYRGRSASTLYSRGTQGRAHFAPFFWLDLRAIFECAVNFYFQPAFQVKNLHFATQWSTMHGSYREANLISAMTVLENLIDSNLPEVDGLILQPRTFEKLRKRLSNVVKEATQEWTNDKSRQAAFVAEFNNRFSDLKRRSFIDKLLLLAKRWGVDLNDIPTALIREAKSARDQVVHRGHYQAKQGSTLDLHDHLLTVREIVGRFILTALQFEGHYVSYMGGQETRKFNKFPPALEYGAGETP